MVYDRIYVAMNLAIGKALSAECELAQLAEMLDADRVAARSALGSSG